MQVVMSEKAEQYVTCMKVYQKLGLTEENAIILCRAKHGRPGLTRAMTFSFGIVVGFFIGFFVNRWALGLI